MNHNADPFDDASELEEQHRDYTIQSIRARKPIPHTGRCLYCNAEIPHKQLYCDAYCKHDSEFEEQIRQFTGVR